MILLLIFKYLWEEAENPGSIVIFHDISWYFMIFPSFLDIPTRTEIRYFTRLSRSGLLFCIQHVWTLLRHQEVKITVNCHDSMIGSLTKKRLVTCHATDHILNHAWKKHLFMIKTFSFFCETTSNRCFYYFCRFGVWRLFVTGYRLLTYSWQTKWQGKFRATNVAHILVCKFSVFFPLNLASYYNII